MIRFFFISLSVLTSGLIVFCIYGLSLIPTASYIKGCFTTKMYSVPLCPGSKNYSPLKSISPFMQQALILSEDSTFFQHHGFDWESMEKSAKENLKTGKYKRGGSTITQQLAKNLFLNKQKTLMRKALEAILTLKIEQSLTKNEILERYLNVVEFGKDIYGVQAAGQYYFNKKPSELDVAESAFLVMLLPSPIKYSASFKKKELTQFAKKRVTQLVEDLYQYQRINQTDYDIASAKIDLLFSSYRESHQGIPNPKISTTEEITVEEDELAEDDYL
jgi:monofunctional biosynthetic peptidoglycan transglycosylase